MVRCFFALDGKVWSTDVDPWQPLPKRAVAAHFGVVEESLVGKSWVSSLSDLRRQRPQLGKSAATAVRVWGYYGPLQPGLVAGFQLSNVGDPSVYSDSKVQLIKFINRGETSVVFSALLLDENNNPIFNEELVLKVNYAGMEAGKDLFDELSALTDMEAQGFECPSLPKLLTRGYLQVHNTESIGNPTAHIIKPLGTPVSELKVNGKQLCKAAFDLFLAIYHLSLINRRHRNVCKENVVYVASSEQFVLVDFKVAHEGSGTANFYQCPRGYCAWLVFTLVEMSNSDLEQRKWQASEIKLAAELLARQDVQLAEFATHVEPFAEDSMRFFHRWLKYLAAACAIPDATVKDLLVIPCQDEHTKRKVGQQGPQDTKPCQVLILGKFEEQVHFLLNASPYPKVLEFPRGKGYAIKPILRRLLNAALAWKEFDIELLMLEEDEERYRAVVQVGDTRGLQLPTKHPYHWFPTNSSVKDCVERAKDGAEIDPMDGQLRMQ